MPTTAVEPIELTIRTTAPPDLAWAYLTDPERVAEWFTDATPVGAVGDPYGLDFGDGSEIRGRILALESGRSFSHEWAWTDAEPSEPTLVTWHVAPLRDGGCTIELRHDGWSEVGADAVLRDEHAAYWRDYLEDLRALLDEIGEG